MRKFSRQRSICSASSEGSDIASSNSSWVVIRLDICQFQSFHCSSPIWGHIFCCCSFICSTSSSRYANNLSRYYKLLDSKCQLEFFQDITILGLYWFF